MQKKIKRQLKKIDMKVVQTMMQDVCRKLGKIEEHGLVVFISLSCSFDKIRK